MKKRLFAISVLTALLVGCSDQGITDQYIPVSEPSEQEVEMIDPVVQVYSLEQNQKGYIIKASKRDKWVMTNASVVYQHPNALIETSNGQLLQGTVVYLDDVLNVAVVHFRSTPEVEHVDLQNSTIVMQDARIKEFISFDAQNEAIQVNGEQLRTIEEALTKKAVSYEQRILLRTNLETYPKQVDVQKNKIDEYEKNTFTVDYDYYRAIAETFFTQYNLFIANEPNTLTTMIVNDDLRTVFETWETFGTAYTFSDVEVSAIVYGNFQYAVQFNAKMGDKAKQIAGTLVLTNIQAQTVVTSFVFEEK